MYQRLRYQIFTDYPSFGHRDNLAHTVPTVSSVHGIQALNDSVTQFHPKGSFPLKVLFHNFDVVVDLYYDSRNDLPADTSKFKSKTLV